MGGRGSAGARGGGSMQTPKTLYNKSQVDELTKDFTPQMFLGDVENNYMGSLNSIKTMAEENAPRELEIGGYTFRNMGSPNAVMEQTGKKSFKDVVVLDYQSTEQIGKEFPVLQVGIRTWRTPKGKVKSEIIRDGYTNKTKFW